MSLILIIILKVLEDVLGIEYKEEIPIISYQEAMDRFGSDKPDVRFGLELSELTDIAQRCNFKVFPTTFRIEMSPFLTRFSSPPSYIGGGSAAITSSARLVSTHAS